MPPRTYVYIDGFNLYYGPVKGTSFKWLNVRQLCELLLPGARIGQGSKRKRWNTIVDILLEW